MRIFLSAVALTVLLAATATAATMDGQVLGGGAPIAQSKGNAVCRRAG